MSPSTHYLGLKKALAALAAAAACWPLAAACESVRYGGAEIPVDSLQRLDGGSLVAFSLGGETRIVAAPDLGRAVAASYLRLAYAAPGEPSLPVPEEVLLPLLRQAIGSKDAEIAQGALAAARREKSGNRTSSEAEAKVCTELLKAEVPLLPENDASQCLHSVVAQAERLAERGLFMDAFALAAVAREAGAESEPLQAAQSALLAASRGDIQAFWADWERAASSCQQGLLRAAMRESLKQSDREVVLELLARSDFGSRTPLEHQAARWLLESWPQEGFAEEARARACRSIVPYAQRDEAVADMLGDKCSEAPNRGWSGRRSLAVLLLALLFCAAFVAWRRVKAGHTPAEETAQQISAESDSDSEQARLLSFFRLPAGASLQEIKAAYRQAIKALHPDQRRGAHSAESLEQFIEATQRYEQLLRMYTERGAGGSAQRH